EFGACNFPEAGGSGFGVSCSVSRGGGDVAPGRDDVRVESRRANHGRRKDSREKSCARRLPSFEHLLCPRGRSRVTLVLLARREIPPVPFRQCVPPAIFRTRGSRSVPLF